MPFYSLDPLPDALTFTLLVLFSILLLLLFAWYALLKPSTPPVLSLDSLENNHVVITGGSSGIGLEIAKMCAKEGVNVTIIARNVRKLNAAKKEITGIAGPGGKVNVASLDLAVNTKEGYEALSKTVSKIVSDSGSPSILFNCAGTSLAKTCVNSDFDLYPWLSTCNYLGTVAITKAFLPHMTANGGGRIVITSSGAGQIGLFGYTAYSGSKFALRGFAEALKMEYNKDDNIYVSVAYPPNTDTPGFEEENKEKPKETRMMEDEGGLYKADVVAKGIVDGALRGWGNVYWGVEGWMLTTVTAGMGPVDNLVDYLSQILLSSLLRFVGLFYLMDFRRIVKKVRRERKES